MIRNLTGPELVEQWRAQAVSTQDAPTIDNMRALMARFVPRHAATMEIVEYEVGIHCINAGSMWEPWPVVFTVDDENCTMIELDDRLLCCCCRAIYLELMRQLPVREHPYLRFR
jgi:hypothetical protein